MKKLSIILPLKDRAEFTPRFIKYCGNIGNLIIADGSREPQNFHRDRDDYFYAGYDSTLQRWWLKMVSAFDRVETPYAMVADNDDLVVGPGVNRCIEFLDGHPDYVAASGRIQGFWKWPDQVWGPRFAVSRAYGLYDVPADYDAVSANKRVLEGFANSWSYYAVYRSDALRTIWNDVRDLDLTDLQVHEKFCAMRALTLGKVMCDRRFTSYLRQYRTSQVAAKTQDFATRLMSNNFSRDRESVCARIGLSGVDTAELKRRWALWYDAYLVREYGGWRQLRKWVKRRFPRLGWLAQNRHRLLSRKFVWSYR